MKKLLFIPLLLLSLTTMAACSPDDDPMSPTEQPSTPEEPGDEGNPDDFENPTNQMNQYSVRERQYACGLLLR